MRSHHRIAFAALVAAASLSAADLGGINLGKHISGPKVSADDLAGKVVLFEYWGIHCPPCLANIPHISEIAALAGPDQLVVIANQCQGAGETAAVWKQHNGTDKPTVVDDGELRGANVSGIPRCFLFDHTGRQVFDGSPSQLTVDTVRKLIDAAPGPLVAAGSYKVCAAEASRLRAKGRSVASVLRSLRDKVAKGKDDARTEAQALLDGVKSYLDKQLAAITANRTADPVQAAQGLARVLERISGDEWAKPFEELRSELKNDKTFLAEVKAAEAMQDINAALAKAELGSGPIPQSKRRAAQEIAGAIMNLIKRYPGTKACREAEQLKEQLAKQAG